MILCAVVVCMFLAGVVAPHAHRARAISCLDSMLSQMGTATCVEGSLVGATGPSGSPDIPNIGTVWCGKSALLSGTTPVQCMKWTDL